MIAALIGRDHDFGLKSNVDFVWIDRGEEVKKWEEKQLNILASKDYSYGGEEVETNDFEQEYKGLLLDHSICIEKVSGFNFQKSYKRAQSSIYEAISFVSASRKNKNRETHTKLVKNLLVGITSIIIRLQNANSYLGPVKRWFIKKDDFKEKLNWCKNMIA